MEAFEAHIQKAIDKKTIANAVLEARQLDPAYKYEKAFGKLTLDPNSPSSHPDVVFWIASCTKLFTSISTLQCVQRGLITLDEPISRIIPEQAHPDILTGFDATNNKPILVKAENKITLRQLLTHTAGMGYPFSSPLLAEWRNQNPIQGESQWDILKEYALPLTFEPGTPGQWCYSVGLDWAGKVVERLNGGIRLGEYMEEHIFKPLGIKDTTFRPMQRPDMIERMSSRVERQANGILKPDPLTQYPVVEPNDDAGGGGLYTTARDYIKVLESLLRDDGKLLDSAILDQLFEPQLPTSPELVKTLNQTGPGKVLNAFGEKEIKINHGLGGIIVMDGVLGAAGKGLMCWDGLPSCFWWVDRERGTCGFYGSQIFPPGDRTTAELFGEFRKAVYAAAG